MLIGESGMPVESTGLSRVKEALETVEWAMDEPLSSSSNLSELHDLLLLSEDDADDDDDKEVAGNGRMKAEINQLEREFFGLKQAILQEEEDDGGDGHHHHHRKEAKSDNDDDDQDQDLQVQKLELLMAKMQALRHRHLDDNTTIFDTGAEGNGNEDDGDGGGDVGGTRMNIQKRREALKLVKEVIQSI